MERAARKRRPFLFRASRAGGTRRRRRKFFVMPFCIALDHIFSGLPRFSPGRFYEKWK